MARNKLMPSIEKAYQKAHAPHGRKNENRKVMQEFLTNYLEVMSDLDRIGDGSTPMEVNEEKPADASVSAPPGALPPEIQAEGGELDVVGQGAETDKLSSEIASLEMQEIEEMKEREEIEHLPDTFFKKAYELMMLSGGDEEVMKQEMNRMIADAQREIGLAFRMAKKKFKEMKVTNITKIRDGMRNINTEILVVKSADSAEYQKTKKAKALYTRVIVNDESGNEGVIYLFEDRGIALKSGMRIKVLKGQAKVFEFSGETALTLGKKGNVYIVL
jgi:hypothetical protein